MAEQKLTQEQIEEIKKQAVAEALAAQKKDAEGSSDSNDKTDDDGKKKFTDKVKDKARSFWNLDLKLTPGKIVLAAVGIPAAILGVHWVYEKGVEAGKSEAEFAGTALPDNGTEPLALETTADAQEVFNATISDLAENFEVESVEEL